MDGSSIAYVRVARGAELLSARAPGWENKIHLDVLDVTSALCCPLGQLYGNYWAGLTSLGLSGESSIDHGFLADEYVYAEDLDEAWMQRIQNPSKVQQRAPWWRRLTRLVGGK